MKDSNTRQNRFRQRQSRRGATAVLICILTALLFVAVAFSIDVGRIQLAQLELQSVSDLSSRAGAEAIARGVKGDTESETDAMLRAEIDMLAQYNRVGGKDYEMDMNNHIQFGYATESANGFTFVPTPDGKFTHGVDTVEVNTDIPDFPMFFGSFLDAESVAFGDSAKSMVRQRDIVLVLDRSTSMLSRDAGEIPVSNYHPNLKQLEDDMYNSSDDRYPSTEFVENDGLLNLTRIQAMKLAVLKFRESIEESPGHEHLGLIGYSNNADHANDGMDANEDVDINAGLSAKVHSILVGDGTTHGNEHYSCYLEDDTKGYRNFDQNYLGIRWLGGTNIADGIKHGALTLFDKNKGARPFAKPILVVLTDGHHNQSSTPQASATTEMSNHPQMEIYTITFGSGADQATMKDVANIGNGQHFHADDVNELIGIFQTIASEVSVVLVD